MSDPRPALPRPERLLAIIELQNAIAAGGLSADEVMAIVVERAAALTGAAAAALAIAAGDELAVRAAAPRGAAAAPQLPRDGTAARAFAERRPAARGPTAAVPLLYGEAAVGALEITAAAGAFGDEDVETLRLLAQIVAIALHRAYTYPRPRQDSLHDPLTNLGNRRAFDERLDAELARNRRYGHSFSLARIELDGLEDASDRLGQAAADAAMRALAGVLQRDTRAIDACFRVGADEFAIVMPGTSLEGARILVERCRAHIAEVRPCDGAVHARIGVVEAGIESADELLARASAAATADRSAER